MDKNAEYTEDQLNTMLVEEARKGDIEEVIEQKAPPKQEEQKEEQENNETETEEETEDEEDDEEDEQDTKAEKNKVRSLYGKLNRVNEEKKAVMDENTALKETLEKLRERNENGEDVGEEYLDARADIKINEREIRNLDKVAGEEKAHIEKINAIEEREFYRGNEEAKTFKKDIDVLRKAIPDISCERAYRMVLGDKAPEKLTQSQTQNVGIDGTKNFNGNDAATEKYLNDLLRNELS